MINNQFEAYKLKRELKRSGITYEFKRAGKNEFGEPGSDFEIVGKIVGLYHEDTTKIQISTGDTTQFRTKKVPEILCLYEDVTPLALCVGDIVIFGGKTYSVTGVTNLQEWNIISNIFLEVVDSGTKA